MYIPIVLPLGSLDAILPGRLKNIVTGHIDGHPQVKQNQN